MKNRQNKKLYRKLKSNYLTDKLYEPLSTGNTKPFFQHLKTLNKTTNHIMTLKNQTGDITEDQSEIANTLNHYFQSVFSPETTALLPDLDDKCSIDVSEEGVLKLINTLKPGKAPGPDGIRKEHLTVSSEITTSILTIIFQYSLDHATVPDEWKLAHVVPIYKKGSRELPSNYRPISLTSICCKMLEHIVLHHMSSRTSEILASNQHGFRKTYSCTTQLASVIQDVVMAFDSKKPVHAVVLDFAKAFDVVPHRLIIQKLLKYNFEPFLIHWINSFLSQRKQKVLLDGVLSETCRVSSGVPQGSVLGPVLFITFINDIVDCAPNSSIKLFADDTLLYRQVSTAQDSDTLQADLDKVAAWAASNGMSFNVSKTSVLVFGSQPPLHTYTIEGKPLQFCPTAKYLGVHLSTDLRWETQVNAVITKASRTLGMIKHTLYNAPSRVRLLAYKTLCRPLLEYACEVWDPASKTLTLALESVQNRAVRFIFKLKGREVSISETRRSGGLQSLKRRRQELRIKLFLKIIENNSLFPTLAHYIDLLTSFGPTRSSYKSVHSNTNTLLNSFLFRTSRELRSGELGSD
jgi:hypothetical protein